MKYDWTIKPSKLSTWIHKHHTEHILRTNLFRNSRINYYEARKSLTGISRKRYCVNDVRGYFQDVFIEQSISFREFPDNHGVEQHQLTTMYLQRHEDYRFIVITSTHSHSTRTSVFVDDRFFQVHEDICNFLAKISGLEVNPHIMPTEYDMTECQHI